MAAPRTSLRAAYTKHILNKHLLTKLNDASAGRHDVLPIAPKLRDNLQDQTPYQGRICIIGAGAAGLYLAMMLKFLGITNVDILEANNRVGGRCYTQPLDENDYPHNYYDIGPMRIPGIAWMQPTLDLIDYLGLSKKEYVYKNPSTPCSYWYRHEPVVDNQFDDFMGLIVADFETNFDLAFRTWMTTDKDKYSTRGFLMAGPQNEGAPNPYWTYDETTTAEIYDTSTGLFDQSFTETVIDYADFQAAGSNPWYRVDGGMQNITDAMQNCLASTNWPAPGSAAVSVNINSPVVVLSNDNTTNKINVTVAGQQPVEYDMVFNTTAMGPLQQMNLEGLELPDKILTGIRSLSYDRATKVAIRFKTPWWQPLSLAPGEIYGGISGSDLPISNVVYPSWNDGPNTPAVLMVSYSWAQDATRMASLVPDYNTVPPQKDDPIVTLCLKNLVTLWGGRPDSPSLEFLSDQYMTHHAFAWSHDPWTGGAFALFGPGQYSNVYTGFQELFCENKFAMCGEALSAHHAWISGALDSAYYKINLFLLSQGRLDDMAKLKASIFGGGAGKHIEEMDEELVRWGVLLGAGGGPKGWGDELRLRKGKKKGSK